MADDELKSDRQVTLKQMLQALDKNVASGIEQKLKKLSKRKAIVRPLDKSKADQVERKNTYAEVSKEVTKWEPIVERNRQGRLKFPLDQEPDALQPPADSIRDLKPQNEFEEEVLKVLSTSDTILHDNQELTKAEERYLKSINVEEAKERHKELQRMRVLLSSYASKMRRQKAIKSKSYRRLLKQERIRKHVKKVESNKDLLMEEIERLQKIRARERASLKHKNTGKWAKHAKFRAKYDEEARKAMLEQIGISKQLTERHENWNSDTDSTDAGDSIDDSEGDVTDHDEAPNDISQDNGDQDNVVVRIEEPKNNSDSLSSERLIVSNELINDMSRSKIRTRSSKSDNDDEGSEDADDEEEEEEDGDDDEEDSQRRLMSEAFADDDVVSEFKKTKEELANEEQPKDIDLFLPGWDSWTGPGTKINKRKKKKYVIKAKKIPRRDQTLSNVIISEKADATMKDFMIKQLPRHVQSEEHLEKRLTRPISATFTDQSTHRERVKPRVEVKMGARIEPISKKVLAIKKARWESN